MLAALILTTALSSTWAESDTAATLTTQQRQCFASGIATVWTAATPANVRYLHCNRGAAGLWGCRYQEWVTGTAAQFATDELAGRVLDPNAVQINGTDVSYIRVMPRRRLTPAQGSGLDGCIATVWAGRGTAQALTIERDLGELPAASDDTFPSRLDYHVSGTAAEYVAARVAGDVVRRID